MTTKAKRRLTDIDFTHEGAHMALCSKSQGAANNWNKAIILKANTFSPEFVKKAQQIQVTMDIPEFLERFFSIWGVDAEVLARLMGYVPDDEKEDWSYQDYVEEKLSAFSIIKSLHEAPSLSEAISKLTEQDYLDVLADQVIVEKVLKELAQGSDDPKVDTSTKVESKVEASASKVNKNKGKQMTQETEMVEKAKLVEIEKAAEAQKVELQKALEKIAQFEEAQKQAVIKSKTDAVNAVIKDEKSAAVIVKAVLALDNEVDALAVVEVFKQLSAVADKSPLFQELGASASAEEDKPQESGVAKILKAKQANQAK